jgi:voltage-gated potassium channel
MQRYHRAFLIAREELILFGFTALIMFYLASVGIYYFEHDAQPEVFASVFHSLWWAVATLTTVGYGDIYPITIGGKIFTFVVLMLGLGFVAVPTGLFASALSSARDEQNKGKQAEKPQPTIRSESKIDLK